MQLVQSSHASSLYLTRVLLARTTRTAVDAACALFESLGPLLDPGSLAGTNFPVDVTAYAISERHGLLLDPDSLAGTNCPADATACVVINNLVTRSCSKLSRRCLPESPWCVRRGETKALNLFAYDVIRLSMAKEDGAGRY